MKKIYMQPASHVVDIQSEGMIAASLGIHSDKEVDTSVNGGQLTNKKGMWGEEEETKNGIW